MNIREFAALKVGDKVEIPMNPGSIGEIVECTDSGVRLVWGGRHAVPSETRFFYSVNSTAWMHWTKVEELPAASHASQYSA